MLEVLLYDSTTQDAKHCKLLTPAVGEWDGLPSSYFVVSSQFLSENPTCRHCFCLGESRLL